MRCAVSEASKMSKLPTFTKEVKCDDCYKSFTTHMYDENEVCTSCRSMRALERIAEAIETWVGWQ